MNSHLCAVTIGVLALAVPTVAAIRSESSRVNQESVQIISFDDFNDPGKKVVPVRTIRTDWTDQATRTDLFAIGIDLTPIRIALPDAPIRIGIVTKHLNVPLMQGVQVFSKVVVAIEIAVYWPQFRRKVADAKVIF